MLLNEFLKEHRKVEKLEATVAALAAQLGNVAAQIQIKQPARRVAFGITNTAVGPGGIPVSN